MENEKLVLVGFQISRKMPKPDIDKRFKELSEIKHKFFPTKSNPIRTIQVDDKQSMLIGIEMFEEDFAKIPLIEFTDMNLYFLHKT